MGSVAGGAVGAVDAPLAVGGAGLAGEVVLIVEVEVGASLEASGPVDEQVVEWRADGAGVGQSGHADLAGFVAGLAGLIIVVVVVAIIAFALFGGVVKSSSGLGGAEGTMSPFSPCAYLATVVAGLAVLVFGRTVIAIVADAIGTTDVEKVCSAVQQPVPSGVAGQALAEICAGQAGGFTRLAIFSAVVVPV